MVLSTLLTSFVSFASANVSYFFWFIIFRFETVIFLAVVGIIPLYKEWVVRYCHLLIRGKNLERFTLINQNKYYPPKLVKFGLTDMPQYSDGSWHWKHKNWTFYASRGNRSYMEDRMHYLNDPCHNITIFSIFDGHGGPFVSQYLEEHFSGAIHRLLLRHNSKRHSSSTGNSTDYVSEAIIAEVKNIDDEILRLHPSLNSLTGSTLISLILEGNRFITVINIGDSRAVACDIAGRAVPLSVDHKPSNEHERKRIENAGGFIKFCGVDRLQGILSVSRAFGDAALKQLSVLTAQPDIVRIYRNEISLQFILVASDGFWDVLTNEQAVHFARSFLRVSSNQWHKTTKDMVSQTLCSILISEGIDLDDAVTSVYFAKFIPNGTTDANRVSLVNRITYGYIAPIIISFGIIGDIMTVATLTRSLFKRSPIIYTYLILLAITDLSTLLSVIPMILWLLDYRLCSYPSALYYAHVGFPLANAFMGTSVWIVVFLTMSQFMAVCHPFHHRSLRTRKVCLLLVVLSYVMNFCIYAPWAVKKVLYELPPGVTSCRFLVCDRKIEMWYKVYEWCRETISRLLPFVLVAYFNSKILITYRTTKKERFQRLVLNQQNISVKSEQEEKQLFTLLFSIVIIFFICTIPAAPLTIFVSDKQSFNVSFQIIRAIINVMEFTKFALNFYLYCLINPNIRLICLNMFRSKPMKKPSRTLGPPTNSISQHTRNNCFSAYSCKPSNASTIFLRSLSTTKPENMTMNESDKRLTTIDDNLTDESNLRGADEDAGDNDHNNIATATADANAVGVITAHSVGEIRLLINGYCSMV